MMQNFYKLKTNIETSKNKTFLKNKIRNFIKIHPFVSSIIFWKRKNVYIKKWEEVNIKEKKRYRINRLQSFFCWIELIKRATFYKEFDKNKFEIKWITPNWITIVVHLREEKTNKKDKYVFYISSYYKQK